VAGGEEVRLYRLDFAALQDDPAQLLERAERRAGARLDGFQLDLGSDPR